MQEDLTLCPLCENHTFKEYLVCKDYTVSKETFTLKQCQRCQFLFTNPRPNKESIGKYYLSDQYISHSDTSKGFINKLYKIVRSFTVQRKVKLIDKQLTSSKKEKFVLDAGCGTGYFLEACQKKGWIVEGYEPDLSARKLAEERLQKKLYTDMSELPTQKKYDVITMWHVLDHVHQLNDTIHTLKSLLTDQGILLIALPNQESYDAQLFQAYWAAYDVPRHLYHFDKRTMSILAEKHQLFVKEVIGMPFDAYYVSLLSNRYKLGHSRYFHSFWTGLKSNLKARKNKNFSSLIYLLANKV